MNTMPIEFANVPQRLRRVRTRRWLTLLVSLGAAISAIAVTEKSGHSPLPTNQNVPFSSSLKASRPHSLTVFPKYVPPIDRQPGLNRPRDCGVQLCQCFCGCPASCQQGEPGEYVEHARPQHVCVYRIRVDDVLRCIYRLTRNETTRPYRLNVGDEVLVESFCDAALNRSLIIQPDGTITLRLRRETSLASASK